MVRCLQIGSLLRQTIPACRSGNGAISTSGCGTSPYSTIHRFSPLCLKGAGACVTTTFVASSVASRKGIEMSVDTSGGHPAMDYKEHERTYAGFIRGTIIGTVLCVLILVGMAVFLI